MIVLSTITTFFFFCLLVNIASICNSSQVYPLNWNAGSANARMSDKCLYVHIYQLIGSLTVNKSQYSNPRLHRCHASGIAISNLIVRRQIDDNGEEFANDSINMELLSFRVKR